MGKRNDGPPRPQGSSRTNKRIQFLEERVAEQAKELRQLHELLGSKVDTRELMSYVGRAVTVIDVNAERIQSCVLDKVGKWTLSVTLPDGRPSVLFKGNLVRVTPVGEPDEC